WSDRHLHYGEGPCPGGLAIAFPGQGSQYVGMGKNLVQTFAEAKDIFSRADAAFDPDRRLSDLIFPEASEDGDATLTAEDALRSTDVAQPAIGAVSAVMMRILKGFGITPAAVCGHSYGEIAALFAAGRLDEKKFFELSVARGKFMARAGGQGDKGGMLAVKAPMDVLEALIQESGLDVVLANRNSPDQGVLSGPTEAIAAMKDLCREKKLRATILPVAAAFHSRLVAAAAAPFADKIAAASFHETGLPVYSNTTGKPYPLGADAAKSLLSGHLMHPVRFIEEIESMYRDGVRIFLEVGPRAVLTGLIKAILKDRPAHALAVDASSGRHNGLADLARALCGMAALGYPVRLAEWKKSET
ncbi:MAG: ACP S-malonyltransferase, partial [Desulfococcus multivorans]|nr:ACP S-malonyltransferase [Desulfococcus multivorans]